MIKFGKMLFIAIYVDDRMIFDNDKKSRDKISRDETKTNLMEKFKTKDLVVVTAECCIGLHT